MDVLKQDGTRHTEMDWLKMSENTGDSRADNNKIFGVLTVVAVKRENND